MWMRNTYVSLDMIFIQGDGRIRRIAENTETQWDGVLFLGRGWCVRFWRWLVEQLKNLESNLETAYLRQRCGH